MIRHLIILILLSPLVASAQQINPTIIGQPDDIILQDTDLYYSPMFPPADTDVRGYLSNQSDRLRDPDGVGDGSDRSQTYPAYTHGQLLRNILGPTAQWTRLFTARSKHDSAHSPSNIIVGRAVTRSVDTVKEVRVSKNEDVDLRASGGVRMEAGFHVMPGAFMHAYVEPRWGSEVFGDEFDHDLSKWHVADGYATGAGFSLASNVRVDTDYQAHDGHCLEVLIRESTDTLFGNHIRISRVMDSCRDAYDTAVKLLLSNGYLKSCPWPYVQRESTPFVSAYDHAPYGKYEVREKIPIVYHHANSGIFGSNAINFNEMYDGTQLSRFHPGIEHHIRYGPYTGNFVKELIGLDSVDVFVSSSANWNSKNNIPQYIYIDNFPYQVSLVGVNTVKADGGREILMGWPSSLLHATNPITFYYCRMEDNISDTVNWSVTQDSHGEWRIFSGAYRVTGTDTLFKKEYQPDRIILTDAFGNKNEYNCRWKYDLNNPTNHGLLWLNPPFDTFTSNTGAFSYHVDEMNSNGYVMPPVAFDSTRYEYHTFGIELFPHELRFLFDSNVVRRIPDRLIPVGQNQYDLATTIERTPEEIMIGGSDWDLGSHLDSFGVRQYDWYGTDTVLNDNGTFRSWTHAARLYFEAHNTDPAHGCWDVTIGGNTYHAAHKRVDYIKVWDVPSDQKIAGFPQ